MMLVVKLEEWKGGNEILAKEIGRMEISNVSGLADLSDYEVVVHAGKKRILYMVVEHARDSGAWELVRKAVVTHVGWQQNDLADALARMEVAEEEARNVGWSLDETKKALDAAIDVLAKAQAEHESTQQAKDNELKKLQVTGEILKVQLDEYTRRAHQAEDYIREQVRRVGSFQNRMTVVADSIAAQAKKK